MIDTSPAFAIEMQPMGTNATPSVNPSATNHVAQQQMTETKLVYLNRDGGVCNESLSLTDLKKEEDIRSLTFAIVITVMLNVPGVFVAGQISEYIDKMLDQLVFLRSNNKIADELKLFYLGERDQASWSYQKDHVYFSGAKNGESFQVHYQATDSEAFRFTVNDVQTVRSLKRCVAENTSGSKVEITNLVSKSVALENIFAPRESILRFYYSNKLVKAAVGSGLPIFAISIMAATLLILATNPAGLAFLGAIVGSVLAVIAFTSAAAYLGAKNTTVPTSNSGAGLTTNLYTDFSRAFMWKRGVQPAIVGSSATSSPTLKPTPQPTY